MYKLMKVLLGLCLLISPPLLAQVENEQPSPSPEPPITVEMTKEDDPVEADLRKRVEDLSDTLRETSIAQEKSETERQKLEVQLARLQKENKKLSEQVRILQGSSIDEVTVAESHVTHKSAAFRLEANRYGSLRVRLLDSASNVVSIHGKPAAVDTTASPQYHTVKFEPLPQGTLFALEVTGLRSDGTESVKKSFPFSTANEPESPLITILGVDPTPSSLTVRYKLSSVPAYIVVECRQYTPGISGHKPCPGQGSIRYDDLGKAVGDVWKEVGEHSAVFNNLKEETEYSFHLAAYSNSDQVFRTPEDVKITKTLATPTPFNFLGPIILEISPTDVRMKWQATAPIREGTFAVKYGQRNIAVTADAKPESSNPSHLAIALPLSKLSEILGKGLEFPPTLVATMSDGKDTVSREIQFSFAVPRDASKLGLSVDQKKAITKLVDDIDEKQSVNWKAIAKAGIPIILSFL